MKKYTFEMACQNSILTGTKISTKAKNEEEARAKCLAIIKNATDDIGLGYLSLIDPEKTLSEAQKMGAKGGAKSRRKITKEQQEKMQKARLSKRA